MLLFQGRILSLLIVMLLFVALLQELHGIVVFSRLISKNLMSPLLLLNQGPVILLHEGMVWLWRRGRVFVPAVEPA